MIMGTGVQISVEPAPFLGQSQGQGKGQLEPITTHPSAHAGGAPQYALVHSPHVGAPVHAQQQHPFQLQQHRGQAHMYTSQFVPSHPEWGSSFSSSSSISELPRPGSLYAGSPSVSLDPTWYPLLSPYADNWFDLHGIEAMSSSRPLHLQQHEHEHEHLDRYPDDMADMSDIISYSVPGSGSASGPGAGAAPSHWLHNNIDVDFSSTPGLSVSGFGLGEFESADAMQVSLERGMGMDVDNDHGPCPPWRLKESSQVAIPRVGTRKGHGQQSGPPAPWRLKVSSQVAMPRVGTRKGHGHGQVQSQSTLLHRSKQVRVHQHLFNPYTVTSLVGNSQSSRQCASAPSSPAYPSSAAGISQITTSEAKVTRSNLEKSSFNTYFFTSVVTNDTSDLNVQASHTGTSTITNKNVTSASVSSSTEVRTTSTGFRVLASTCLSELISQSQSCNLIECESQFAALLEHISIDGLIKTVHTSLSFTDRASLIDLLHEILQLKSEKGLRHRRRMDRFLSTIVKETGQLPNSMIIDNVKRIGANPFSGGGFADVWRGMQGDAEVAMKVLRVYGQRERGKQLLWAFCAEALIWHRLHHRNVMPFLGVCIREFAPQHALISPWMKNGHLLDYLREHSSSDRCNMMLGVALGLEYLHTLKPAVVHGDLRASNVLIDDDGQPRISDFGLATFIDSQASTLDQTSFKGKGSMRWQAPELLDSSRFNGITVGLTTMSDVYAFACVCLEIFTEKVPFSDLRDGQVILEVAVQHRQPPRPLQPAEARGLSDATWALMQDCWASHPGDRPSMPDVLARIQEFSANSMVANSMLGVAWPSSKCKF